MIRRGACRALVHWFTNHYRDFSKDSKKKKSFLNLKAWELENDPPSKNNLVGYLVKMLDKKNDKGTYTSLFDAGIMVDKDVCPDPVIPKSWQNITFMDLDDVHTLLSSLFLCFFPPHSFLPLCLSFLPIFQYSHPFSLPIPFFLFFPRFPIDDKNANPIFLR